MIITQESVTLPKGDAGPAGAPATYNRTFIRTSASSGTLNERDHDRGGEVGGDRG